MRPRAGRGRGQRARPLPGRGRGHPRRHPWREELGAQFGDGRNLYLLRAIGLLGEVDEHPTDQLIATIRSIYDRHGLSTQLMAAVRSACQLVQSLAAGADEITAPAGVWKLVFQNGHTLARWNAFISNWQKAYGDRTWLTGY